MCSSDLGDSPPGRAAPYAAMSVSDDEQRGAAADSLEEQRRIRADKVAALRAEGVDPYPDRFARTATAASLHDRFGALEPGAETGVTESVAGRVMLRRNMGKLIFLTVRDVTGDLQLFVSKADLGDAGFDAVAEIDLGEDRKSTRLNSSH